MTATIGSPPLDAYLDAVRSSLHGVSDPEREELLDDLAEHLAELAAEEGETLVERLGPPEAYAADLVASAGLVSPEAVTSTAAPAEPLLDRVRSWWSESPSVRATRRFLPELRPGWWLLRAYLLVCAVATIGDDSAPVLLLPRIGDSRLLGLALAVVIAAGSVALGRRSRWGTRAASVAGVVALVVVALNGETGTRYVDDSYATQPGILLGPNGNPITNIWPYDGAGNPIDGVLLYDQDGVPISLGEYGADPTRVVIPGLFPQTQDWQPNPPVVSVPSMPTTSTTTTTLSDATESTDTTAAAITDAAGDPAQPTPPGPTGG